MEKVEVDNRDRPIENIYIQKAQIFVDPFQEADEQLERDRAEDVEKLRLAAIEEQKKKHRAQPLKVYRQGIGKYLSSTSATATVTSQSSVAVAAATSAIENEYAQKKKKKPDFGYKLDNFNSW